MIRQEFFLAQRKSNTLVSTFYFCYWTYTKHRLPLCPKNHGNSGFHPVKNSICGYIQNMSNAYTHYSVFEYLAPFTTTYKKHIF